MKRERRLDVFGPDGHDDGVAGVVTAREACADVGVGGEYVHELALALVAPLCPKHGGHSAIYAICGSICWPAGRGVSSSGFFTAAMMNGSCSSPLICRLVLDICCVCS